MEPKLRHILALNIKNRRNLLGFSQAKLAEIANLAPGYVALIELEKKFPSDAVIERIAVALDIEPSELFSKTCFPVEEVLTFHKAVSESIEQAVKSQIAQFEEKSRNA